MKLSEEPRLPSSLPMLVVRLTDLLRPILRQLNAVTSRIETPIEPVEAITVGASPYTYTAATDGVVTVTGGTVSAIGYGRRGTFTTLGVTSGLVPVKQGDAVRVTYTSAPTMRMIPQ